LPTLGAVAASRRLSVEAVAAPREEFDAVPVAHSYATVLGLRIVESSFDCMMGCMPPAPNNPLGSIQLCLLSDYVAVCPPSTSRSAPVMKELALDKRKTTGPASQLRPYELIHRPCSPLNSSCVDRRPSSAFLSHTSFNSGFCSSRALVIAVRICSLALDSDVPVFLSAHISGGESLLISPACHAMVVISDSR